jgi:hypothetical protein
MVTVSPNPDHLGGADVRTKQRAFLVKAGHAVPLNIVFTDPHTFNAVNLTTYGLSNNQTFNADSVAPTVVARFVEHATDCVYTGSGVVVNASAGTVTVTPPEYVQNTPAVWHVEVSVKTTAGLVLWWEGFVYNEQSRTINSGFGPPTQADVRTYLRDFASENELLDAVDFDLSEIALAASLCVDSWNSADPFDGPRYTTATFPFKSEWLLGISSYLFNFAAEHYFRNDLQHQGGGNVVEDKRKGQIYAQRATAARQEWLAFITRRKRALLISGAYSYVPGLYEGMGRV